MKNKLLRKYRIRETSEADLFRQPDLDKLEGYLLRREGGRLAYLAAQVPAGQCIVEIGSFKGKSACYLARGAKAGNRPLVHCVDLWDLGGQPELQTDGQRNVPRGSDDPSTFETFLRQIDETRNKTQIRYHKAASIDVARAWSGPPIGLLFIDGDHTYKGATADIEAWTPFLAERAWVCWHDYMRPHRFPEVLRAVNDWMDRAKPVEVTLTANLLAARVS